MTSFVRCGSCRICSPFASGASYGARGSLSVMWDAWGEQIRHSKCRAELERLWLSREQIRERHSRPGASLPDSGVSLPGPGVPLPHPGVTLPGPGVTLPARRPFTEDRRCSGLRRAPGDRSPQLTSRAARALAGSTRRRRRPRCRSNVALAGRMPEGALARMIGMPRTPRPADPMTDCAASYFVWEPRRTSDDERWERR